jgi:ferrochelatase
VPIAFVSEHSETLVELDIKYEKLAKKNGCANYTRIEALGINEDFIDCLSDLILYKKDYKFTDSLYPPKNKCPSNYIKCPCLS